MNRPIGDTSDDQCDLIIAQALRQMPIGPANDQERFRAIVRLSIPHWEEMVDALRKLTTEYTEQDMRAARATLAKLAQPQPATKGE